MGTLGGLPPLQHSPLSATPTVPMSPPPAASSVQPPVPSTSSAPHATTPLLELPNPYGGNAPKPSHAGGLGLPPPNSVWNAPSPLSGPGGIRGPVPDAYAKPPGMSTTVKVLLGLGIGSVVLLLTCCGGVAILLNSINIQPQVLPVPVPVIQVADEPNGMPGRVFGIPPQPPEVPTPAELQEELDKLPEGVAASIFEEKATEAIEEGNSTLAMSFLMTAIRHGGSNRIDLARLYAAQGNLEASLAWVEEAMQHEGINDISDLEADDEIRKAVSMRNYRAQLADRLQAWLRYYANHPVYAEELIVPAGYTPDKPIPVVVGLHGYGDNPHDFNIPTFYQELADEKQIAFLMVSGTVTFGPKSFKWSTNRSQDAERINLAFQRVADKLTPAPGKVVTLGFSHGAMVATHVPLRNPDMYAGGIVLSPGGPPEDERLPQGGAVNGNQTQHFVMLANAGEFPGNVAMARSAEKLAKDIFKCQTLLRIKEGDDMHSFPSDYFEQLGGWIDFALSGRKDP